MFGSKYYVAGLLLIGVGGTAQAQTAQTTMDVTATVVEACVVAANNLTFGSYDPTSSAPKDASTSIAVTCTPGTIFTVALSQGAASGATVTDRQMVSGANRLRYGLFSDAARITNIGDTPGVDALPAITARVAPSVQSIFGRIPPQQTVPAGDYRDTVTVTVTY